MTHPPESLRILEAASISYADFETFFRQALPSVYRALAIALPDRDLAEEATAESMARAYQHWRRVRAYENPAGWAYRVGLNWATSRLRRRRFQSDLPVPEEGALDAPPTDPVLVEALRKLSANHREVLVMHYFLDMDQRQIAATVDIPVGTVKSRIGRALRALEQELQR
jgi:RNA polymerase sigma-70 factor (ECF subfamily)